MLWADTHRLGCGFVAFLNPDNVGWYTKHFVCNYGPAGNRLGALLYKVGPAGTGCEQQDIAYPALCVGYISSNAKPALSYSPGVTHQDTAYHAQRAI